MRQILKNIQVYTKVDWKVFLFTFFIIFNFKSVKGDNEKFQITLLLSPTYESFTGQGRQAKLSYNFGLDYKHYLDPKVTFQTGIVYQNKGFKTPVQLFPGYNKVVMWNYALHYISIPTNFNLHIETGKRNRILLTMGLTNGFLLKQTLRMSKINETEKANLKDEYGDIYSDETVVIDIFRKRYTGINLGIGFMQFVKKKIVLEIHPMLTRQLNYTYSKNITVIGPSNDKLYSLAIDFKIGYYINRQISQKEKSF